MRGPTVQAIFDEVMSARRKHPGNAHLLAALMEEVGELSKALLEGEPRERIEAEAVQVACVAVRIIEEGDADFGLGSQLPPEPPPVRVVLESGHFLPAWLRRLIRW